MTDETDNRLELGRSPDGIFVAINGRQVTLSPEDAGRVSHALLTLSIMAGIEQLAAQQMRANLQQGLIVPPGVNPDIMAAELSRIRKGS